MTGGEGYCPRGAIFRGGYCPGAIFQGAIVRGAIVLDPSNIYIQCKSTNTRHNFIFYKCNLLTLRTTLVYTQFQCVRVAHSKP